MMIDLKYMLYVIISMVTIGAAIVKFFQMQTKQNMELERLKEKQSSTEHKQSEQSKYQIKTEKDIIKLDGKIDQVDNKVSTILEMMKELKDKGCGRCLDKT